MRVVNEKLLNAVDLSAATSTSGTFDVQHLYLMSLHAVIPSTTAAGTISIQTSLNGTDWFQKDTIAVSLSGAALNTIKEYADLSVPFVRAVYTKSTGTGSLTLYVNAKGF